MANRSSNKTAVPEAKGALDSSVIRWLQRRPDIQTEWICRRLYGQENDRTAGKTDGR